MYNGNLKLHSNKDIVEEFNNYFLSIGKNIAESIHCTSHSFSVFLTLTSPSNSLFLKPASVHEIVKITSSLKLSKSVGPDCISSSVVKQCISLFADPLCYIFNMSLMSGLVPKKLKIAKVVPVYKKNNNQDMSNYRPIAVLPIFSKILEKIIYSRLYDFLQRNNILIDEQFGFRKQYSTSLAIFNLSHCVQQEIAKGNYSLGLFMDLSKAFDTIDHHILLKKLYHYGVRGTALDWFSSYLNERQQYVVVDGVESTTKSINHGVPQGSVLGPLLFLVYINDIVNSSKLLRFSLFADDTFVLISHKNLQTLFSSASREIVNVSLWFKANKLALNTSKTNFMLFRSRKKRVPQSLPLLSIDNIPISQLHDIKFLGVMINEHLDWSSHITRISKCISRSVGILFKLRYILPSNVLKLIYFALIHSHLNYCNHIWGNTYATHIDRLHVLQKKSIRNITKSSMFSHTIPLFKSLNILPLQKMVILNSLIFMFFIHKKILPEKILQYFY